MNPNTPQQLGRPPSYTYANNGGGNAGQPPPHLGRPSSPMPQPPINIVQAGYGHPPPVPQGQMYAPVAPQAGLPRYPTQQQDPRAYGGAYGAPPPAGPHSFANRGSAPAEVEGSGRSRAQLIVGIDFGTTFSGVAFAFATNTEAKEDIIVEWPGAGNQTKQK
ncbi:hypothetical protein LTR16_009662, partial [Cryomyces antarcticus]